MHQAAPAAYTSPAQIQGSGMVEGDTYRGVKYSLRQHSGGYIALLDGVDRIRVDRRDTIDMLKIDILKIGVQ